MTLSHIRLFFVVLGAGLLLTMSSCSTAFQAHQDMLLTVSEKGDLKATGSINKTKEVEEEIFVNGQVAYSPIKHLALSAKYFSYRDLRKENVNPFFEDQGSVDGHFTEFAIGGYYEPKWQSKGNEAVKNTSLLMPMRFTGDLYVGAGTGKLDFRYGKTANELLEFNRMFAHVGVHFQWKIVKISYAFKLVSLDYKKIVLNGDTSEDSYEDVQQLIEQNPVFYRSSSLRMQMGPRHAQVYVDMNFNSMPDFMETVYFYEKIGGIGLIIDINEFWKKNTIPKI